MIREAAQEDASAIAAIHVRAWQAAYGGIVPSDFLADLSVEKSAEFWQRELALNRNLTLVAPENGQIAGWISGGTSRDTDASDATEVHAIYVSPEFWGRGFGQQLLLAFEAATSPSPRIALWCLNRNLRALRFYEQNGYRFDGAKKTLQLGDATLWEVRLEKRTDRKASPEISRASRAVPF